MLKFAHSFQKFQSLRVQLVYTIVVFVEFFSTEVSQSFLLIHFIQLQLSNTLKGVL